MFRDIPSIPYSTVRHDPKSEFKKLSQRRKWENPSFEEKKVGNLTKHSFQIGNLTIEELKGWHSGIAPTPKQAERNAINDFLDKYENYKYAHL